MLNRTIGAYNLINVFLWNTTHLSSAIWKKSAKGKQKQYYCVIELLYYIMLLFYCMQNWSENQHSSTKACSNQFCILKAFQVGRADLGFSLNLS